MRKSEHLFLSNFGKRMAKVRKSKGFTQEKLAFAIGVSPSYIGFIEQGRRNPTILNIFKISRALDIKLEEIFSDF
jgi:transcriptional regulator with XRE-family HTH domain